MANSFLRVGDVSFRKIILLRDFALARAQEKASRAAALERAAPDCLHLWGFNANGHSTDSVQGGIVALI
jgi:hypothetical protein